jgi:murein DD-endopeptidase MepM/ murein hydrolase activator NlpD
VLAVEDGKVIRGPYLFYDVVYALEVQHPSGIVRYGEISRAAEGIAAGVAVKAGQVIGYVGKMKDRRAVDAPPGDVRRHGAGTAD